MTWTIATRWSSPAKWSGSAGTMRGRKARVFFTGTSDAAADLSTQVLVTIANLNTMRGDVCTQIALTEVNYQFTTMTSLTLLFDHGTDDAVFFMCSSPENRVFDPPRSDVLTSSDGTGNLILATTGGAVGSKFSLDITFRIK